MTSFQLDRWREQVDPRAAGRARRRFLWLIAIGLVVGLGLGYLSGQLWTSAPEQRIVELTRAEQDDYIIMVAEAYAVDRNVELAQQRLVRLNDPRTAERIIALAQEYAPQRDYVAQRLALLAVAAGSSDAGLVGLAATLVAPTITPQPGANSSQPVPAAGSGASAARATNALRPTRARAPTNTLVPVYIVVTGVPTETPPATSTPRATRTGLPTRTRAAARTATPVIDTNEPRPAFLDPMPSAMTAQRVGVDVPGYAGFAPVAIALAARPRNCTPPEQMPAVVSESVELCAGRTYGPVTVMGNNLTLYGDPGRTAVVQGAPRGFAITVQGTNVSVVGVRVEGATHGADLGGWLCLYPRCPFTPEIGGAQGYGGGLLLKNTVNAAVVDSEFHGGTTGVFSYQGYSNKLFRNSFGDQNGWGVMLLQTRGEYVVGNAFAGINRSCTGLDGVYHANGCESAALAMTQVSDTLVLDNRCRRASNCYYANGDGGYGSAGIKFYNNQCLGARNNCFEVTFGRGHEFDYNRTGYDADYGDNCDYPVWIGGSTAYFGPNNDWNCLHDYDTAVNDARGTADQPTEARALAERPIPTPTVTVTARAQLARPKK